MGTMQRQSCLDMMQVGWTGTNGFKGTNYGIILEIDPAGGLVQTTVAIPVSSKIMLNTGMGLFQGHVTGCEEDPTAI
jgi:hydrogenase/urease accessory protein HupE